MEDQAPTSPPPSAPGEEHDRLIAVLQAQAELQDLYIRNGMDRAWWDAALRTVIALSGSEFGFLGRIEHDDDGVPFLLSLAITDIAWNEWSRQVFDEFAVDGLPFRNLDSLFGVTVATGDLVVSDEPATDPRRCGLPPGHPPLKAYIGLPLNDASGAIGMVGLANRAGGYDAGLEAELRPVLAVISTMVGRDIAERRAAMATAEAVQLGTAIESLNRLEREREAIDTAVREVLVASSLDDAARAISAAVEELSPGMHAAVLAEDPADAWLLVAADGSGHGLVRGDCMALQSGRMHVSLPGIRLGACRHADPLDAVTICCPISTEDDEYGLVVARSRAMAGEAVSSRAAVVAGSIELLAAALAQVALRAEITSRALRDPLTGLPNRTALQQAMERRLARIEAAARPFGVMIVDLDDFKDVNDQLGHAVGDDVLTAVANALLAGIREDDVVARIGGDEFVVLLDSGEPDAMRAAGQRLIDAVSAVTPAGGPGISASAGGVPVGWGDISWDDAYQRADVLLYEAKAAGKNQVVVGEMIGSATQE
jgi:diguanylate cyclase (GGDEF)-like protein